MNYLQILLAFCAFIISSILGFLKAEKCKEKKLQLEDFLYFIQSMEYAVNNQEFIKDCIIETKQYMKTEGMIVLCKNSIIQINQNNIYWWNTALEESKPKLLLNNEEYTLFKEFGNKIGNLNAHNQEIEFNGIKKKLEIFQTAAQKNMEAKSKLYVKLGILFGIAFFIFVI